MKQILTIIIVIMGGIIGVALGDMCSTIKGLSWLAIGGEIGFKDPLVVNLSFLEFTIGIWCKINIAGVIGLLSFALVSRKVLKWAKI